MPLTISLLDVIYYADPTKSVTMLVNKEKSKLNLHSGKSRSQRIFIHDYFRDKLLHRS